MGFGTLFFGYFLLLNIYYYSFTDLVASLVMAIALQKLSTVNLPFKKAFYVSFVFGLVGAFELVLGFIDMFFPVLDVATIMPYIDIPRYIIVAILTLLIFSGIENVSQEVGLSLLAARARISMIFSLVVYFISSILSVPFTSDFIPVKVFATAGVIIQFTTFFIVCLNLYVIHKAYAKICMPEDNELDMEAAPSRFEFINRHREHTKQKQREYAEYKLEKMKKKASRKKK